MYYYTQRRATKHDHREGTRLTLLAEQIQDDFPSLSLREIYGAISYYLEHEDRVSEYLRRREEEAGRVRAETEDRPRIEALRRRVREQYVELKAKPEA